MTYYSLQKIVLDRFPRKFFIQSAIVNDTCMQKLKIGHRAKFRDRNNFFPQVLSPFRAILCRIFTSGVLHLPSEGKNSIIPAKLIYLSLIHI